jgi:putative oxidoreductase
MVHLGGADFLVTRRPGLGAYVAWGIGQLERVPLALLQLAFRAAIAGVFLSAGLQKVMSWDTTVALFRDEYRVPLLAPDFAAGMAASTEIGGSILLLLGLGTRLAVLPMLGMIAVIQTFVYPEAWPEHLTWTCLLVFLLTRGGGAFSLDRLLGLEPPG